MSGAFGSQQWMYASGGFYPHEIETSVRLDNGGLGHFFRTPASTGNRKTFTWSGWFKRSDIANYGILFAAGNTNDLWNSTSTFHISYFAANDRISIYNNGTYLRTLSAKMRDTSSWYHLVVAIDTTNSTAGDRVKVYINGVEQTSFSTTNNPSLNLDTFVNATHLHVLGGQPTNTAAAFFDGYLAEVNFIDGSALTASSFGEFKEGIWVAKDTSTLTFGTNGFYLPFKQTTSASGFNTVRYVGNNDTQSVEGVGFSPDLVWIKNRDETQSHYLFDTIRGADKALFADATNAETDYTSTGRMSSFNADGFTVKYSSSTGTNANFDKYVAWCWDAGTGSSASNTDGTITSTVKANQDYGFSIVQFTNTSSSSSTRVGHGLDTTPSMIIVKATSTTENWYVYHTGMGTGKYMRVDLGDAQASATNLFNTVNSTVFNPTYTGTTGITNIAYCFADVDGYQKAGSYEGTGSSGLAITGLGFKPAFLMIKNADRAGTSWTAWDAVRDSGGLNQPANQVLKWDISGPEETKTDREPSFTSDGFTINGSDNDTNASGDTYIYLAIADTRDAVFTSDASGNGNDFDQSFISHKDLLPDTPTNNFSTYHPEATTSGFVNEAYGNLRVTSAASAWSPLGNTMYMSSGKWYWEIYVQAVGTTQMHGIVPDVRGNGYTTFFADIYPGSYADEVGYRNTGAIYRANGGTPVATYSTYTTGDILGFALDMDNGTLDIYKNNSSAGAQFTGLSGTYRAVSCPYGTSSTSTINFGQDSSFNGFKVAQGNKDSNQQGDFFYSPPSGYLALCNTNLPNPAIDPNAGDNPTKYFNTVLWTGNGASSRSITGVGFQPDWVWTKARSANTGYDTNHWLSDAVRGAGSDALRTLYSNRADAEFDTLGSNGNLTAFTSDGFTITEGSSTNNNRNKSSESYIAWNWKANGAGESNTDGSITSTVSVNEDAGFSIATYTGTGATATVGHGLSKAPNVTIIKPRNFSDNWIFTHDMEDGSDDQLYLNLTNASSSPSASFTVSQNASTVGLPSWNNVNDTGDSYVMYCFTEKEGYSKFGKYKGNGSANGSFVYTGFRPAYVLIKQNSTANWTVYDAARDPDNAVQGILYPGATLTENTGTDRIDFYSNGFKWRESSNDNTSGFTHYYMAFAEQPFKYANAR